MRVATNSQTPVQVAGDLNCVAAFLASDDFAGAQLTPAGVQRALGVAVADVLVLLGNSVLHTSECAFVAMQQGVARHLVISGGTGHSTMLLVESLAGDPEYKSISGHRRSEAALLCEVASGFYHIDRSLIVLETESTNCGENAQFTFRTLASAGVEARTIILLQDPTMQLRSAASFRKVWSDAGLALSLANYPTFVPEVIAEEGGMTFANYDVKGLWPIERFISLVLGEIPRLCDDANGYGPRGHGYIEHVDIPADVLEAHQRLVASFPEMIR